MASETLALTVAAVGTGAAALIDLRTRRVPNALTATFAVVAFAVAATGLGRISIGAALVGCVLGIAFMLPGHIFGATGAGDVKLFAAAGALLGPMPTIRAFMYTAMAGGVLALIVAVRRRRLQRTIGATARLVSQGSVAAAEIEAPETDNRFAYAPAIAIGVVLAALSV